MLILRDPVECLLSHQQNCLHDFSKIKEHLIHGSKQIQQNLEYYTNFSKEKDLIIFEELVFGDPKKSIQKISDFCENSSSEKLLENVDMYFNDGRQSLLRKGNSGNSTFYSDQLSKEDYEKIYGCVYDIIKHPLVKGYR